jgi:hypothetical protein
MKQQAKNPQRESRIARIQAVFAGDSIREFGDRLDQADFFTEEDRQRQRLAGRDADVRDALGQVRRGIPFAGPGLRQKKGRWVWLRPTLWSKAAFDIAASKRTHQILAKSKVRDRLSEMCKELHGIPANDEMSRAQVRELLASKRPKKKEPRGKSQE